MFKTWHFIVPWQWVGAANWGQQRPMYVSYKMSLLMPNYTKVVENLVDLLNIMGSVTIVDKPWWMLLWLLSADDVAFNTHMQSRATYLIHCIANCECIPGCRLYIHTIYNGGLSPLPMSVMPLIHVPAVLPTRLYYHISGPIKTISARSSNLAHKWKTISLYV